MSSTSAPFGMRPSFHPTGLDRATAYTAGVASAYATAIYKGSPVILATDGTITIGTTAADIIGAFDGVEYTDSTGKPTYSNFWPASTTLYSGTTSTAYVWDQPGIVYDIQSDGSIANTAVGDQADFAASPGSGSASTGLSTATISHTLAGAGQQGQLRIVGLSLFPDNAWGDAYTVVQAQIARHQYIYNKVGI